MPTSTLTSKGQVTIPKQIRERLGLKVGDRLGFQIDAAGALIVKPEEPARYGRLPGLLRHLAGERPVTAEEMSEAIRQRARRKFDNSGGR